MLTESPSPYARLRNLTLMVAPLTATSADEAELLSAARLAISKAETDIAFSRCDSKSRDRVEASVVAAERAVVDCEPMARRLVATTLAAKAPAGATVLKVRSSSSDTFYRVTVWAAERRGECTCQGFAHRKRCRHVAEQLLALPKAVA